MMPILRKELRTLLRERKGLLVPVLYALALAVVTWLHLSRVSAGRLPRTSVGQDMAETIAFMQSLAVVIFAPLIGASMVASERERGTWARLLTSRASRSGIVIGKLAGGCLYVALLLSISFPLAALSLLYGGLDVSTLVGLYFTHAWVGFCLVAVGLGVSVELTRTWAASILALGLVLMLVVGAGVISLGAHSAISSPLPDSVYANAAFHRAELLRHLGQWFNPLSGLFLFDGTGGQRLDWYAHYAAMLVLGGSALGFALLRVERAEG